MGRRVPRLGYNRGHALATMVRPPEILTVVALFFRADQIGWEYDQSRERRSFIQADQLGAAVGHDGVRRSSGRPLVQDRSVFSVPERRWTIERRPASPDTAVAFSDLYVAARRQRVDQPYVLWTALKAHIGHVERITRGGLAVAGAVLGWNRHKIRRIVRAGAWLCWSPSPGALWLYSPARVALALAVPHAGVGVAIPFDWIAGPTMQVRAKLLAAAVTANRRDRPTSTASIAQMALIGRSTVRKHLRISGAHRYGNCTALMICKTPQDHRDAYEAAVGQSPFRIRHPGPTKLLVRLLPNTIAIPIARISRTRQRRANKRQRQRPWTNILRIMGRRPRFFRTIGNGSGDAQRTLYLPLGADPVCRPDGTDPRRRWHVAG